MFKETHEITDSDEDCTPLKKKRLDLEDPVSYQDHEQTQASIVDSETESFGRTIGFQLKELNHMQRFYAEKLISDVIFQARLCNLSAETSLNLGPE